MGLADIFNLATGVSPADLYDVRPEQYPGAVSSNDGGTFGLAEDDAQALELLALIPNPTDDEQLDLERRTARGVVAVSKSKQDKEGEDLLPKDTYSFLAIARGDFYPGLPFLVGFGVFAFQVFTLTLLAIDTVDQENEGNVLDIPGGVDYQVRWAQLIAIIITVISQDEVRLSLNLLYYGYDPGTVWFAFCPKSTYPTDMGLRWFLSWLLRLLAGLLALAVTFMLLISVDSVRELLLNFTAVEFVSNVDDAVFALSEWGYFCSPFEKAAQTIVDAKWAPAEENIVKDGHVRPRRAHRKKWFKYFPLNLVWMVLIFVGMTTAWGVLSQRQANGDYLTKTVYVQFGDEFSSALGTFSGLYKVIVPYRAAIFTRDRFDYVAVDKSSKFRYCRDDRFWAFIYGDTRYESLDCMNKRSIRAVSTETFTFDLFRTSESPWLYRDHDIGRDVPIRHFSISPRRKVVNDACDEDYDEEDDDAEDGFKCIDGMWKCTKKSRGENCQFSQRPCAHLQVDERYRPFADARSWSAKYDIVWKTSNGNDVRRKTCSESSTSSTKVGPSTTSTSTPTDSLSTPLTSSADVSSETSATSGASPRTSTPNGDLPSTPSTSSADVSSGTLATSSASPRPSTPNGDLPSTPSTSSADVLSGTSATSSVSPRTSTPNGDSPSTPSTSSADVSSGTSATSSVSPRSSTPIGDDVISTTGASDALKDDSSFFEAYGRPIYIGNETYDDGELDVMFFTGRRWVLTRTKLIGKLKNMTNPDRVMVASTIADGFHAHWDDFKVEFISEAVDVDTPADVPTPVGLHWFRSKAQLKGMEVKPIQEPDLNQEEEAILLCTVCDVEDNPCVFGNCTEDEVGGNICACDGGASGTLCQIKPIGDGKCDTHFNTAGYGWDGGDCCPFSCEARDHSCGVNHSTVFGIPTQVYIGFPHCEDPRQSRCDTNETCWKVWADLGGTEKGAKAGSSIALSGNGQVVAFYEPGVNNQVRIFVNSGKMWQQRGEPLRAMYESSAERNEKTIFKSASTIALSDDGNIIAIVAGNTIEVFHWKVADIEWTLLGGVIPSMDSVALSGDGLIVAGHVHGEGYAQVYKYAIGEGWKPLGSDIELDRGPLVKQMSLSRDGKVLAVGQALGGTAAVFNYQTSWNLFGPTLNSTKPNATDPYAVALSANGCVLAVGRKGRVDVFVYNGTVWEEKQFGLNVKLAGGKKNTSRIESLSLSSDGSSLAVGIPFLNGVEDHIEFYVFNETANEYFQFGRNLKVASNDDSGTAIALSRDGNVLAFGAPMHGRELSGTARVMWRKLHTTVHNDTNTPTPSSRHSRVDDLRESTNITIAVQLDDVPWETGMSLICDNSSYGHIPFGAISPAWKGREGTGIIQVNNVTDETSCTFEVSDIEGDGICCREDVVHGNFSVYYGADKNETKLLARGGPLFGSREHVTFRVKDPASLGLVRVKVRMELKTGRPASISASLSCENILELTAPRGAFRVSIDAPVASFLLPKGTRCEFQMLQDDADDSKDTGHYNITEGRNGKVIAGGAINVGPSYFIVPGCTGCECTPRSELPPPMVCANDEKLLRLEVNTTEKGAKMKWVTSNSTDTAVEESFSAPCDTFVSEQCVAVEECLTYEISNTPYAFGKMVNYSVSFGNITKTETDFQGYGSSLVGNCSPTPSPSGQVECEESETALRVELVLDWYPQQTTWEVRDKRGNVLLQSDDYSSIEYYAANVAKEVCVPKGECLLFVIDDIGGNNGMCCEFGKGRYIVSYGSFVETGGNFTNRDERQLGHCGATEAPSSSPSSKAGGTLEPWPTFPPTSDRVETIQPTDSPSSVYGTGYPSMTRPPLPEPTLAQPFPFPTPPPLHYTRAPTPGSMGTWPTRPYPGPVSQPTNYMPTSSPTNARLTIAPSSMPSSYSSVEPSTMLPTEACPSGFDSISIEVFTDSNPEETAWSVYVDGIRKFGEGPYDKYKAAFKLFTYEDCVPNDECIEFFIGDKGGDGLCCLYGKGSFKVYVGKKKIGEGSNFGYGANISFGPCES